MTRPGTPFALAPEQEVGVPTWVLVVLFTCQALVAVCFFLLARLGARRRLPRNAFFGLRTGPARDSDAAWEHVHHRAAPFVRAAFAVVVAGLVAMAATTRSEAAFLAALLVPHPIAGALLALGAARGHRDLPAR
ncbi:SdpI family protein [Saccharothrix sp. Mg75]|uniref:SdpI family protein n=1 Tax=Saccharothrix sp. Mg75 TaxID=3445357 RepID=UPI003EEA3733